MLTIDTAILRMLITVIRRCVIIFSTTFAKSPGDSEQAESVVVVLFVVHYELLPEVHRGWRYMHLQSTVANEEAPSPTPAIEYTTVGPQRNPDPMKSWRRLRSRSIRRIKKGHHYLREVGSNQKRRNGFVSREPGQTHGTPRVKKQPPQDLSKQSCVSGPRGARKLLLLQKHSNQERSKNNRLSLKHPDQRVMVPRRVCMNSSCTDINSSNAG